MRLRGMKSTGAVLAIAAVALAAGCSSSSKPAAAPAATRTVVASPSATAGLDGPGRLACSKTDDAITAYGDGTDVGKSATAITDYTGALTSALTSKTAAVTALAKSQLGTAVAPLAAVQSAGPQGFTDDTSAMRDACVQAGWTSTSTPQ